MNKDHFVLPKGLAKIISIALTRMARKKIGFDNIEMKDVIAMQLDEETMRIELRLGITTTEANATKFVEGLLR